MYAEPDIGEDVPVPGPQCAFCNARALSRGRWYRAAIV